ncbi:MAG: PDZ domain-containing protein [Pseudomonadota bacterium]
MLRISSFLALGLTTAILAQPVTAQTRLLGDPAIHQDKIAFVYAGDLYTANIDGSAPYRLTSNIADETGPVFSPDGSRIAYTANYQGNTDVYSISVNGGQPQRHTYHPSPDIALDWSTDGSEVAFVSTRQRMHGRSAQLYHVSTDGGLPELQMQARIFRGRYNDNGRRFAAIPFGPAYNALYGGSSGWKGYRGGTTPSIQIMDMRRDRVSYIPGKRVNDIEPMWVGDQVYFISDRDSEIFNIHRFDPDSGAITKVTTEEVWDIRAADAYGNQIIYEAGGELKRLDTINGSVSSLSISLTPDLPQLQSKWTNVAGQITAADLSKSAKRVLVTARGEVFSVPVEDGSTRNISDTSGVREYGATWSPDGQHLAYIVEADRKQHLIIEDQSGTGEVTRFELGDHFYSLLDWGGEGDHIIYRDNHLRLYVLDTETGRSRQVSEDARRQWGFGATEVSTSPNGEWLAYTREEANFNRNIYLYNFETQRSTLLTDGMADAGAPAFSADGELLYFTASTNAGPTHVGLDMSTQERPYRASIYVSVLTSDGLSPLAPKIGDEEAKSEDDGSDEDGDEATALAYDLAGARNRIQALPVEQAQYSGLSVGDGGKLYYVKSVQPGTEIPQPGQNLQQDAELIVFDFEDRSATSLSSGITGFTLSADRKHALVRKSDGSLATGKLGDKLDLKPVNTGDLQLWIDPELEWGQIFDDVWRMQIEFFYDPNMHGIDWQAVYDRYRPLLAHVGRREDLNRLMAEMIAELQVGHNRVGGGDIARPSGPGTGLLGADLAIRNGRHQITRIYTGENWNPTVQGPLAVPGLNISEGDYIIAINGQDLGEGSNIFEHLAGTAGKQVTLTISDRANGRNSRNIVVEPTGNEFLMRLWSWIESNRKAVDEATDGRVGYVYLPNTAGAGYTLFNRMFFSQTDKNAMIIDERSNGGGQAANYITDVLSRTYLSGWKDRDGLTFNTPASAMFGPKLMLIDQDAGSGGDFLPYSFREMGIGTLMGTRTWGGLIGISANPGLVDGGFLVVPYFRFFDADYEWSVENEGVAPDIEVALDPIMTNKGRDSQLEAAIAEILRQLEANPSPIPSEAPPYPTELGE